MERNDPGREPEPTDAVNELAKMNNVNAWAKGRLRILAEMAEDRGLDFFCRDAKRIADGITVLDRIPGARPMPDTKLCGAVTQAGEDRKFRTCEKPAGHDGMHETTICGQGWSWMPNTPAPDEVAQLRARIAELERENAALGAEVAAAKDALRLFVSAGSGQSTDILKQGRAFGAAHKVLHPSQYAAPGKEAPYAE